MKQIAAIIEPLDAHADGLAFLHLYRDYLRELSQYVEQYGNPYGEPTAWWVDDPDVQAYVARVEGNLAGFVINGWGSRVDADTDCEILECYVAPKVRRCQVGRRLAVWGISQLSGRVGLQVYFDNTPAQHFWPSVLATMAVNYETFVAIDNTIPVIKYRFLR